MTAYPRGYARDVFLNCPFDDKYRPPRDAIVFTVFACKLRPRCALDAANAGRVRIVKIMDLIGDCRWGIHDIFRTELSPKRLPRFNVPLELGLFPGAHRFGYAAQRLKSCRVLDRDSERYRDFMSDISAQDVVAHGDDPTQAIKAVRDWLATELPRQAEHLLGGQEIARRYTLVRKNLPALCKRAGLHPKELTFAGYCLLASEWLKPSVAAPA